MFDENLGKIIEIIDPEINYWAICNSDHALADTYGEMYEYLYVKIYEMTNILIARGANRGSLLLTVPPYMTERLVHNSTDKDGFVGWCNQKWRVYQDSNAPEELVEIGSNIGKAVLVVLNFYEKVI